MPQLQHLMHILSDAKISQQDIFMLYIDFSSAFNTVDHDKLLQIIYDLGFPEDAVRVVADLYTNATTKIKIPAGTTAPIQLNRGTIQGDSLSPLLFLIFFGATVAMATYWGQGLQIWMPAEDQAC